MFRRFGWSHWDHSGQVSWLLAVPAHQRRRNGNHEGGHLREGCSARLVVLGGGVAGCELAQAWASLDTDVILIEEPGQLGPSRGNGTVWGVRTRTRQQGHRPADGGPGPALARVVVVPDDQRGGAAAVEGLRSARLDLEGAL